MKLNLLQKLLFAAALAFTASLFIYFAFANIYSSVLFDLDSFSRQYYHRVYQYRILSSYLVETLYNLLKSGPFHFNLKIYLWDQNADPLLYISFAFLNTFFTVLCAVIMVLITESRSFIASQTEKILLITAAIFAIIITQFVIVPYDCSSYFFLLLFFWVFLKYLENEKWSILSVLMLIVVISSLNRESSALSISFAATALYSKYGIGKKSLIPVTLLLLSFITVYIGLRLYFGKFTTNDNNLLIQNFNQYENLFGLLFWAVFFIFSVIISKDQAAIKNIIVFHVFAFPYIFMCFYAGVLYETRLYVPLFLTSLFLSRTNFQRTTFKKRSNETTVAMD